jgi:polysaccharide export outer membrane protein
MGPLLLGLVACRSLPRAPPQPADDPAFAPAVVVAAPGLPEDAPEPYVLRPGDVLRLRTVSVDPIDAPDLMVDGAGVVHIPLAGDVKVGGLRLAEAEAQLTAALRPHDHYARVTLSVTSPGGQRATIVGAVIRPGVYELKPDTRLAELLALAGGPKTIDADGETADIADLEAARVVRRGVALPVSFPRGLRGETEHNVRVHAGDLVYVPASRGTRVVVLGEVRAPRVVTFRAGLRLTEALALAGGTTKDADEADVRVIRGPLGKPKVYLASFKALRSGSGGDVELAPGDVVFVTEHWIASATDLVNRLTPFLSAAAVTTALVPRK